MMQIHERVSSGGFPNCSSLGEQLEVSYKTIQRDIDFMRDRLELPVEYDPAKHGFYYTTPVASFPTVSVSEGEVVALLVAQKAIEQYRGTPFEKPIASAFHKLAGSMHSELGISLHALSEAFSFKPSSLSGRDLEDFQRIADAVVARRVMRFTYRGLEGKEAEDREIEPYHLGCIADQWYLIGKDRKRRAIRTFALPRIRRPLMTEETFSLPKGFRIGNFLADSFSAFEARKATHVVLKLDSFAARLAGERIWHRSQKVTRSRDGSAKLSLRVGLAPDLENWILSWGDHAEVISPASLRRRVLERLKSAAGLYSSAHSRPSRTQPG
jgi:predicted DNA-binding transcriptional regulator YafY